MPAESNTYEFPNIPTQKLQRYCNFMSRIQEDEICREIDSELSKVLTLESKIEIVRDALKERRAKYLDSK